MDTMSSEKSLLCDNLLEFQSVFQLDIAQYCQSTTANNMKNRDKNTSSIKLHGNEL